MTVPYDPGEVFVSGDRIVYAAEYHLAGGSSVIVWFKHDGRDKHGRTWHSDLKRAIVTAKPGEVVLYEGKPRTVERVEAYRESRLSNVSG